MRMVTWTASLAAAGTSAGAASGARLDTALTLTGLPDDLSPSPDQARRWVADELAKDEYRDRRSLLQRFFEWLNERLQDLQGQPGNGGVSLPSFVIAGLVVVLVLLLAYFATKIRRERRTVTSRSSVLGDSTLTADQLRSRAATAMGEPRWDDALLDYTRAIARDADRRTLLSDAPSLTAHEIGRQLAVVFPDHAGPLTTAMDLFDAVAYGDLVATREDAQTVSATDELLRRARPRLPERPRPARDSGGGSDGPHTDPGSQPAETDSLWTTGVGS